MEQPLFVMNRSFFAGTECFEVFQARANNLSGR